MQKPLDFTTIVTPTVVSGFADLYKGYDERKNVFLTFEKAKVLIERICQCESLPLPF